jgi:hypothetical protein
MTEKYCTRADKQFKCTGRICILNNRRQHLEAVNWSEYNIICQVYHYQQLANQCNYLGLKKKRKRKTTSYFSYGAHILRAWNADTNRVGRDWYLAHAGPGCTCRASSARARSTTCTCACLVWACLVARMCVAWSASKGLAHLSQAERMHAFLFGSLHAGSLV